MAAKETQKKNKAAETKKKRLSKKERDFAKEYSRTGNGTKAALKVYETTNENVAANIASENIRKPKVREFLAQEAAAAAERVKDLSIDAKNETVRLNANKDILDRAGFKPVEKSQSVVAKIEVTEKTKKSLKVIEQAEQQLLGEQVDDVE